MRVTYKQLKKFLKIGIPQQKQKLVLKRIFSYPENIDTFAYYIFPEAIKSRTPKFHYEIYDFLQDNNNGAVAAPRGFAKSTIVGLFFLSWCIINKQFKYIVYMSQNYKKTVQFVDPLRTEFQSNKRIKYLYGDLTPKNIKDTLSGKNREDMIDIGGVRVQAVSFNNNIRGFKHLNQRPDLIIGDDIDDDERVLNPDLRYKDYNKLTKQVIPSLSNESHARFKMIGTILHWDSLLMRRININKGKIYKACELDDEGNITPNSLLWPSFWGVKRLKQQLKEIGSVSFSSEYLNNPIENEASLIKMDWLKKCFDTRISYNDKYEGDKFLGVDFAFGDRVTNDESAFIGVTQISGQKLISTLKYSKGMSITEQFEYIEELHKEHKYNTCVLEENSIRSMSKELYNYKFPYYLIWTGSSDTIAKLKPDYREYDNKRHSVSKTNMIKRLATEFENETIILPYKTESDKELTNKLCDELLTFALQDGKLVEVGIHADGPIALAMACEKMNAEEVILDW